MPEKKLNHLAIILDGNRRWARKRGLSTLEGHKRGYDNVKKVGKWCLEKKIGILTVYAFSTENWNRSKHEVSYLMKLLKRALTKDLEEFHKMGFQLRILGRRKNLPKVLQEAIKKAMDMTKNNSKGILNICLNYGGRAEIADAVKEIVRKKIPVSKIDEKLVEDNLYTTDLPDPDMIVRTSGENRLSGFLLWQASYSELYFIKKHWPEFSKKELEDVIKEYNKRQRFGG